MNTPSSSDYKTAVVMPQIMKKTLREVDICPSNIVVIEMIVKMLTPN
jgi:hypothetical protein